MYDEDQSLSGLLRSITHRPVGTEEVLPDEGRLPSFGRATTWLDSEPLTPEGLRGRVVLVDFWTYTCVNWLRTLPYLRAWHDKYADAGLTIVGVHTPEFGFERDLANVVAQSRDLGLEYPVAVDTDYGVWNEFANHYWPAIYLADADGRLRYHRFGEGAYSRTEMVIQQLLVDAGSMDFERDLVSTRPHGLEVAAWDLTGDWTHAQHAAVLNEAGGRIAFEFHARDLNLVMGPAADGASIPFQIYLDGEPVTDAAGTDVDADGRGTVRDQKTYQLVRRPGPIDTALVEVEFLEAGVEAYCFTFG